MAVLQPSTWKRQQFTRRFTRNDAINRTRALHEWRAIWWRIFTTDKWSDFGGAGWQQLFPGKAFLADFYRTQNRGLLWIYAGIHPCNALIRAGMRRLRGLVN